MKYESAKKTPDNRIFAIHLTIKDNQKELKYRYFATKYEDINPNNFSLFY